MLPSYRYVGKKDSAASENQTYRCPSTTLPTFTIFSSCRVVIVLRVVYPGPEVRGVSFAGLKYRVGIGHPVVRSA